MCLANYSTHQSRMVDDEEKVQENEDEEFSLHRDGALPPVVGRWIEWFRCHLRAIQSPVHYTMMIK